MTIENKTPKILYRYYRFNEFADKIFTHNEICFRSPKEFNDPYDTRIRYVCEGTDQQYECWLKKYLPQAHPGKNSDQINELIKDACCRKSKSQNYIINVMSSRFDEVYRNELGVFCLTEDSQNILMWAHYAHCHEGFCLGFDAETHFFGSAIPVNYDTNIPTINVLDDPYQNKQQNVVALLTKSKEWEYERERRLVNHQQGPGVYKYPPEALKKVIFGCRIQESNKSKIMALCKDRKPKPEILQAKMAETKFLIELELV